MFRKLMTLINHPYAAPLTETFKGVFSIARAPLNGFIEAVKTGWDDEEYRYDEETRAKPKFARVFKEIFDGDEMGPAMIGILGAVIGGGGLAFAGGAAASGGGIAMTAAAAVAGLGIGVAAGPFILAGAIGLAAAAVGSVVGGVPGFLRGVSRIFEYRRDKAAYAQAMQMLPVQPAKDDVARKVAPALAAFNELAPEHKEPFVRMMNEEYADVSFGRAEQILKAIDALPGSAREGMAKALKEKLKLEFAPVAAKEPPPAPEEDDGIIVAPKTASFRRHHQGKEAVAP